MKLDALLEDPNWFPHRLDWQRGSVTFLPTDAARLRAPSFIDGREDFSTGAPVEAPLDALLAAADPTAPAPPAALRFIFHISFCGSTLLATLLDQPGMVLALKEPNILVDLADWKALDDAAGRSDPRFAPTLALMLRLLHRPPTPGEPVAVKPSNWVNNLLPDLTGAGTRAVFVGMDARTFILALFRGGRDRLAYNARAVSHIVMGDPAAEQLVRAALASSRDPLQIMARLGAVSHYVQMHYFRRVGAGQRFALLDFSTIAAEPRAAAAEAASALDLPPPQIPAAKLATNAKQRDQTFSVEARRRDDLAVEQAHGARADEALAWAAHACKL